MCRLLNKDTGSVPLCEERVIFNNAQFQKKLLSNSEDENVISDVLGWVVLCMYIIVWSHRQANEARIFDGQILGRAYKMQVKGG